jgi:DNA-binding beta-propeller fold protein YncE
MDPPSQQTDATARDSAGDVKPASDLGDGPVPLPDSESPDSLVAPDGGCPPGHSRCGEICVDLTTDVTHCGKCDKACDDGNACTSDICQASTCQNPNLDKGTPCNDGISCTENDICKDGACVGGGITVGFCIIGAACLTDGAPHPSDTCLACEHTANSWGWTPQPNPGCVITLAGNGNPGFLDGEAHKAKFNGPSGLALDPTTGTLYVADSLNQRIRAITPGSTGHVVSTVAGTGFAGFADGAAATAKFNAPLGLARDFAGNLWVADSENRRIRKIHMSTQMVTAEAGDGTAGFLDGPVATAKLGYPFDVAPDGAGAVYVADALNHRIRKVASGYVTTVAGDGTAGYVEGLLAQARFDHPKALVLSAAPFNILVADHENHRIGQLDPLADLSSTLAGSGTAGFLDGLHAVAQFQRPVGLALGPGPSPVVYVTDLDNHAVRQADSSGVTTLAGQGVAGFYDGSVTSAKFSSPWDMAVDTSGKIYLSDRGNHRIRLIVPP